MTASVAPTDGAAFDVIVVGAGVAGVSCALSAAEHGARVAIVDADRSAGGTARSASGGVCIAGSPLQRRMGIADSPELALRDWLAWGGDSADALWAERYLTHSADEVFRRLSAHGISWSAVYREEGNSVARWHAPTGGGAQVMATLVRAAQDTGRTTWFLGHRALEISRAGGRVTGLRTHSAHGQHELHAPAVVIASGGFGNSAALVDAHTSGAHGAERILLGGGVGATGDGHRMLASMGAQFTNLDRVWMYPYATPDARQPESRRGLVLRDIEGDLWINDDGVRFHDESKRGGSTGAPALLRQPNGRCWSVIDARLRSTMSVSDPYYRDGSVTRSDRIAELVETSPFIVSARDLGELAVKMGVDRTNLSDAVREMNAAIRSGAANDPAFGAPLAGRSELTEAPFFAIRFHPLARKNLGGVRTDMHTRVLDDDDRPIDGLFAAGEVAGMAGGRINGDAALEGTMFGPSMFSGAVAGSSALGREHHA